MRYRLPILVSGALIAATLVGTMPAQGMQGQGFTMDDAHPKVHMTYGPLAGNDPVSGQTGASPDNCSTLPADALIQINVSFKRQVGTLDTFSTSWTGAQNDIDTYMFDSNGNQIATATAGDTDKPEIIRLGNLTNGTYFLCVVSFSGANTGFTVDASRQYFTLYHYTPPAETPAPTPAVGGASTPPPPTPAPVAAPATPAPTAEPVLTPGPNGPDANQGLVAVSGQRQASNKTKRSIAELIFLILTVLIGAAGVVFVALRIRRDTA